MKTLHGKIGLALGGGGAKGLAHIGVIRALEEKNIKINHVAGTSMGAIIGVLFCNGYSSEEIFTMFATEKTKTWFKLDVLKGGLVNLDGVKNLLVKYLKHNDFNKLKIPLKISAVNLNSGRIKIIGKGNNLTDWVIASASVPIAFTPKIINQQTYIDGGILMNLPAEPLSFICDSVIASNVVPDIKNQDIDGAKAVAERVFNLSISQNIRNSKMHCDIFIEPEDINKYSMWDFNKLEEIVELGYNEALSKLKDCNSL
ncbi:MAG: patatin-like phospholipase family protein [Bacteroidales bacterium]